MIEKEKRMGLVLVITGLIISILAITKIIELYINLGLSTSSWDILLIPSGALGLLLIIVGIYSLLSNPRMKIIGILINAYGIIRIRKKLDLELV